MDILVNKPVRFARIMYDRLKPPLKQQTVPAYFAV
jgi:hypothetical protein